MGESNEGSKPLSGLRELMMPSPRASVPAPVSVQVLPLSGSNAPAAQFAQTVLPDEGSVSTGPTASVIPSPPSGDTHALWSGRIRAAEEVGRGAMGQVLRGIDTKLRRDLALKVTPVPRQQLPMGQLARFIEEAQITAQLEHPNVVPVHDLGVDPEGRAYFSMKLVRGQSLEAILEKRKKGDLVTLSEFGLRRLLDVFLDVCQAVEYAHARGVIHRDLKPANIMVGDFGEVLVMDWGVAKLKGRKEEIVPDVTSVRADIQALATQSGAIIGTPAYMAPEQANGKNVDERSDIYSLGVILYEILCGEVPFNSDDPLKTLLMLLSNEPKRPSEIVKNVPPALEALSLRLLEKDPERRTLAIRQTRALVQDHIEGIGGSYRRESFWSSVVWVAGALGIFAFLVWYLTGQSVATVIALTPATVFNAFGWMLVVMTLGVPLWAVFTSLRVSRGERDRFRPASSEELFVSGYLAHRTFAASVAPLFQLAFVVEIFVAAVVQVASGRARSAEVVRLIVAQLRAEWAHALIVIIVFLFGYLFLLSTEVRFARRIDRYLRLVQRPRWEMAWPLFLVIFVVATVFATNVLDWIPSGERHVWGRLRDLVLTQRLNLFEIVKTLVFQGTFLLGLVASAVLLSFPFPELLASLRVAYQATDEASVSSRPQYFLRSMAVFQILKSTWLYGGVMIGSLTAVKILSEEAPRPLVEQVIYILGPSLIGFFGFMLARRYVSIELAETPSVRRMLDRELARAGEERAVANAEQLRAVSWQTRLLQLAVPIVCIVGYLLWTGSGVHQHAIKELILPVSTKGWLLILPYALLIPLLLVRDWLQLRRLEARTR